MAEKTKADALYAFGKSLCTLLKEEGIDTRLYGLFTEEPEIVCSKDGAALVFDLDGAFEKSSKIGIEEVVKGMKASVNAEKLKKQKFTEDLAAADGFCEMLRKYGYKADKTIDDIWNVTILCFTGIDEGTASDYMIFGVDKIRQILANAGEADIIRELEYSVAWDCMDALIADFGAQLIGKLRNAGYMSRLATASNGEIDIVCMEADGKPMTRHKLEDMYNYAFENGGLDDAVKHIESLLWENAPAKKESADDGYVYMRFDAGKGRGIYFAKSMAKLADGDKDKLLGSLQDVYEELYEQQLDAKFISREEYEAGLAEKRIPPQIVM